MSSVSKEEIHKMIHEEVFKVVSSMKDTLILQLIGFMRDEHTRLEKGLDAPWEPMTPLSDLEQNLTISAPIVEEEKEDEYAGDSEGDKVERQD